MPDSVPTEPSALQDPLTRLPNERAFHERLAGEFARAGRHGRPLSVAIAGIDHFDRINLDHGRAAGDAALVELARRLSVLARQGELVARIGGDTFAWILPDADGLEAFAAAERIRRAIAALPVGSAGSVTVSIGVCDIDNAPSVTDLYSGAQQALRWAKHHGRNESFRYSLETAAELAAIAPPPSVSTDSADEHAIRVANLAAALAVHAGWSPAEIVALRRAALIRDDRSLVATCSAQQLRWVRHHRERWDGTGEPDGLRGDAIPEGAQLLALADAYTAIARELPLRAPAAGPLEQLRRDAGTRFSERVLTLLEAVVSDAGTP